MGTRTRSSWFWRIGCCGLAAALLFGVGREPEPKEAPGRFQIYISTIAARHTFLLDTSTGETWAVIQNTDPNTQVQALAWESMRTFEPPKGEPWKRDPTLPDPK